MNHTLKLPPFVPCCVSLAIFILSSLVLFFATPPVAFGATRTWDGGGSDNNWSTCANWSSDTCPIAGDSVTFDSTSSKNSTIDSGFSGSVSVININSGFTGTIHLAKTLRLTTFTQSAGTFDSGSNDFIITGSFNQSGGIFNAPNGTLSTNSINYTGGTFNPGVGTTYLNSSTNQTQALPPTLHNLTLNDGLVGYWKMDDESSTTSLHDSSPMKNDSATISNRTWSSGFSSKFFNPASLSFNGVDGAVQIPNTNSLYFNQDTDLTLSAWVKTTTTTEPQFGVQFIYAQSACAGGSVYLALGNGYPWISLADINNVSVNVYGTFSVANGEWRHIVAVRDTANKLVKLYVDGQFIIESSDITTANLTGATTANWIGKRRWCGSEGQFTGDIDDLRIYRRALSDSEIATLASGAEYSSSYISHTLSDSLTLTGNLSLNGATLNPNSHLLSLQGNWINNGGSFTPGTGTVTLTGTNQLIQGSTTFNNLTKSASSSDTLTFEAKTTQTIMGNLLLSGSSSGLLSLRSSSPGNQWLLAPNGPILVNHVNVQDSHNLSSPIKVTSTNSIDAGNNTGWTFIKKATILPSSPTSSSTVNLKLTSFGTVTFKPGVNQWYYTGRRPTFKGTAEPGTEITVEIHSDPITCTTRADSSGNWSCTPDQDIPDGNHSVSITNTGSDGKTETIHFKLGINIGLAATGQRTILISSIALLITVGSLAAIKQLRAKALMN